MLVNQLHHSLSLPGQVPYSLSGHLKPPEFGLLSQLRFRLCNLWTKFQNLHIHLLPSLQNQVTLQKTRFSHLRPLRAQVLVLVIRVTLVNLHIRSVKLGEKKMPARYMVSPNMMRRKRSLPITAQLRRVQGRDLRPVHRSRLHFRRTANRDPRHYHRVHGLL